MPEDKDLVVANRLADLQEMGLTHQEAVVYTELVSLGPSHARRVSERARLPREDLYRILKRLESKGLVEVKLDRPSVFAAVEPRTAVRSFISKLEGRSRELTERAYDLGIWLEAIKGTAEEEEEVETEERSSVRVFSGMQVAHELEKAVTSCHRDYVGLMTPLTFLTVSGSVFLENLVSAHRRGVRVRIVTEVSERNLEAVRRYSKTLSIRHNPGASQGIRFSVFDASNTVLALADPAANPESTKVLSSDIPTLAHGLAFYFEQIWSESLPTVERVHNRPRRVVGIR